MLWAPPAWQEVDNIEGLFSLGLTLLPLSPQHYLNADIVTFTEVSKDPKGMEWLWNPQIVGIYNRLLQRCELNKHTTEAASGALQNITAGDRRVRIQEGSIPGACTILFGCHCWSQPHLGGGMWPSHSSPVGSPCHTEQEEEEYGANLVGASTVCFCLCSGQVC